MRLMRIGAPGRERPAVDDGGGVAFDLSSLTPDIDRHFLAGGGMERARAALDAGDLPPIDTDGLRMGAPVAQPGAVICVGHNYREHAAESGSPVPTEPVIFFKHPNTVVGPHDPIVIPPRSTKVDWEVELGIVIGRRAYQLADDAGALDCIAGYTVSNDVSEREYQFDRSGGQWSKGKSFLTFNPLGPYLVPAADAGDARALRLRSWVNSDARQDGSTSDMIFPVAELVRRLSWVVALDPGDVVNSGTPAGVALSGRFPYLGDADLVECEIDGLGRQRQYLTTTRTGD